MIDHLNGQNEYNVYEIPTMLYNVLSLSINDNVVVIFCVFGRYLICYDNKSVFCKTYEKVEDIVIHLILKEC